MNNAINFEIHDSTNLLMDDINEASGVLIVALSWTFV
jgi:hypothetical protein